MDNQTRQPIDQTALFLSRAIRKQEGGDYNNMTGDNGTSAGAYQWNNGKIPLNKGDVPANFKSGAEEFKLDPNDFSETNQDHLAYLQIKKDLDNGLTQSQIAAKWNSGLTHGWENHVGDVNINGKVIHYDTPSYVSNVKKYYEDEILGKSSNNSLDSSNTIQPRKTFQESVKQIPQEDTPNPDLKAESPKLDGKNNAITSGILGTIGGGKLAQGLGYTISNVLGTQNQNIEAQNQGEDTQAKLIQRIKENKAVGRDTTRLQKALDELTSNLERSGKSISDVGTGGITNGQILSSAGQLGITALGSAWARGAFKNGTALASPEITNILKGAIGKGETISNLSRQEAINTLGNYLKEMSVSESGGKTEQFILKALKELNPTLIEKESLLSKGIDLTKGLIKNGVSTAIGYGLGSGKVGTTAKGVFDRITR